MVLGLPIIQFQPNIWALPAESKKFVKKSNIIFQFDPFTNKQVQLSLSKNSMKTRRKSDKREEMGPVNHPNSDYHPAFFE
jgi:hypothetical protein